ASLVATNNSGGTDGSTQSIALTGTATAAPPPNRVATGAPTISDTTPQLGQTLTAITTGIADLDGFRTPPGFTFQWQFTNNAAGTGTFTNIPGAAGTGVTFRVPGPLA